MIPGRRLGWSIASLGVAVLALGITVVTLGFPSSAPTRVEAKHLGFGYPIGFVWVDKTTFNPPGYPQTYFLNPWEDPGLDVSGWRFALDWFLVTAMLWTPLWLLRRAVTSLRTSPSPG